MSAVGNWDSSTVSLGMAGSLRGRLGAPSRTKPLCHSASLSRRKGRNRRVKARRSLLEEAAIELEEPGRGANGLEPTTSSVRGRRSPEEAEIARFQVQ